MKLKIEFTTKPDGCKAVNALNRLTHDIDGRTLRAGQKWLLVDDAAKPVGMARVVKTARTPAEHAAALIQPVIDGTRERGSVTRLIDTYEQMTGERPNYGTFMRWLEADSRKRMQPAIGCALALAAAFERMQQEDAAAEAKRAVEKATTP